MSRLDSQRLLALILGSALAGILVATLEPDALKLLFAVVAIAVGGILVRFHHGWGSASRHPVATFLVGAGVFSVAWIGVRGPAQVPLSDLPILVAGPLITLALLRRGAILPLPPWLLVSAGGLAISALLAALFVTHPPSRVLGEQSALTLGAASSRASDLALLARMEYALILVPVLIGVIASSWSRARLVGDLWLMSAAVCAGVAFVDHVAGTGISDAVVSGDVRGGAGGRAEGLTTHPNYLGLFAAMALPLGIVRVVQTSGVARIGASMATVVLALGVQQSGSRLAVVAVLIGVAVLVVCIRALRARVVAGFLACVVIALGLFLAAPSEQSALERLSGEDPTAETATDERIRVIEDALEIGLDHPMTGVGFGRILDSHSVPVQFLMAGGIVALASFVLWAMGIVRLGWTLSRNPLIPSASAQLAAALLSGLSAWLLTAAISPQLAERYMYVPAGVLLGLGLAAARLKSIPPDADPAAGPPSQAQAPDLPEGWRVAPSGGRSGQAPQRLAGDLP